MRHGFIHMHLLLEIQNALVFANMHTDIRWRTIDLSLPGDYLEDSDLS